MGVAAASLWERVERPTLPTLRDERAFDIAVLGGGITGLTTALLLKREGARVAVLEADRVGAATTARNTAKATALQSTLYRTIRAHRGAEAAAIYAAASTSAVEKIAELSHEEGISCDLHRRPAYTYATSEQELPGLEEETAAAQDAGLTLISDDGIDLPFPVRGALRLDDQIEFQPVQYATGLARAVHGDGCEVFEHSRALTLDEGSPCRVTTAEGAIRADHVVVATHYPIWDRGLYFARLEPHRSYCIAARIRGKPPQGLSINTGGPTRSVRSYGDHLVVCGESHPTGARSVSTARYERLEEFAKTNWNVDEITHRWSAQDPTPYDHFPMVGAYTPWSSRLHVATGFMKWGLTGGTFAGMVLADLLSGRDNPWAKALSPTRFSPCSAVTLGRINLNTGAHFVGDRLAPATTHTPEGLQPGQAGTLRNGTDLTGTYRDENNELHAVSLRCTHLGCLLRFNGAERSWDCPCHGSRFDIDGAVLEGPAVHPLETKTPPEEHTR